MKIIICTGCGIMHKKNNKSVFEDKTYYRGRYVCENCMDILKKMNLNEGGGSKVLQERARRYIKPLLKKSFIMGEFS